MAVVTGNEIDEWYKGKPKLRVWELNENSTRYDVISAAPSDDELDKYWWSWAVIALLVGTCSLILFLSILWSPEARRNPFNIYLLYLAVPDFVFSLCCGVTCLLNAINGEYWSEWMCNFQQWYCVFGIGANAWLNACITRELYTMLKWSDRRKRYKSPTRKFVSMQAMAVFAFSSFLGVWGIFDAPNWPFHSGATSGLACLPIEVDQASSIFFWLAFFPLFAGIPSLYIMYVTYDVLKRKLLPPTGKRRLLAVYFGRLILVFYVMWVPTLLILFAFSSFVPPWVHFLGGLWSHLQGAVSVAVSLMKPDILQAVKELVTCRACSHQQHLGNRTHAESIGVSRSTTYSRRSSWLSFRKNTTPPSNSMAPAKQAKDSPNIVLSTNVESTSSKMAEQNQEGDFFIDLVSGSADRKENEVSHPKNDSSRDFWPSSRNNSRFSLVSNERSSGNLELEDLAEDEDSVKEEGGGGGLADVSRESSSQLVEDEESEEEERESSQQGAGDQTEPSDIVPPA